MTSLQKIKINYGKEILAQLNDSISLQNQLYDPFFHILDVFVQEISNPTHLKNWYHSNKIIESLYKLSEGHWLRSIGWPSASPWGPPSGPSSAPFTRRHAAPPGTGPEGSRPIFAFRPPGFLVADRPDRQKPDGVPSDAPGAPAQGSQAAAASKYIDSEIYRRQRSLVTFDPQAFRDQ